MSNITRPSFVLSDLQIVDILGTNTGQVNCVHITIKKEEDLLQNLLDRCLMEYIMFLSSGQ